MVWFMVSVERDTVERPGNMDQLVLGAMNSSSVSFSDLLLTSSVESGLADTDRDGVGQSDAVEAEGKEAERVEGETRDMMAVTEEEVDPEEAEEAGREKEAVGVGVVRCVWVVVVVEVAEVDSPTVSERVLARWA